MAKSASSAKSKKPPKLGALPEWNLDDLYAGLVKHRPVGCLDRRTAVAIPAQ